MNEAITSLDMVIVNKDGYLLIRHFILIQGYIRYFFMNYIYSYI